MIKKTYIKLTQYNSRLEHKNHTYIQINHTLLKIKMAKSIPYL